MILVVIIFEVVWFEDAIKITYIINIWILIDVMLVIVWRFVRFMIAATCNTASLCTVINVARACSINVCGRRPRIKINTRT